MFDEDKDGNRINDCESCPGTKRALLQCGFEPTEYESAGVPLDLRGDHVKVQEWLVSIDERTFEQEQAFEVTQAFWQQTFIDDSDKETCFKLLPENRFAMRYIIGYRTDGDGAPKYRVDGGTYSQLQRDLQADNIIHGVMKDGERSRASKAGSTG